MALRDFSNDLSALALNTATLGHNIEGHGAGWPAERIIDACAERGIGGIVFWRREIAGRAVEIGNRVRAAGMDVVGLCRTPFVTGPDAGTPDDMMAAIDMAAASAQLGEGTPSPMRQSRSPSMPALRAAPTIFDRPSSVCAEQVSNLGPASSCRKRSVNGVMTGRGEEISKLTRSPEGTSRFRRASTLSLRSSLSAIAVIVTRRASIEILERGSASSASRPKSTALSQPSGIS